MLLWGASHGGLQRYGARGWHCDDVENSSAPAGITQPAQTCISETTTSETLELRFGVTMSAGTLKVCQEAHSQCRRWLEPD